MTQVSNFVLVIISKYKKVLQEVFEVFEWPISVYVYIYMDTLSRWNELKCIFSHIISEQDFLKQCMTDRYQLRLINELYLNVCGLCLQVLVCQQLRSVKLQ